MGAIQRPTFAYVIFALAGVALAASLANLFFLGINGNPFVLITCAVAAVIAIQPGAIDLPDRERFVILVTASALALLGLIDHNHFVGFNYNLNAVGAALVILSAYIIARFLHRHRLAYAFALVGFFAVLIPAAYLIVVSSTGRLSDLFTYSSENFVTSWLIITSLAMCSAKIVEGKPPPIWPVAVTFVVALSQYTRGSIVVSFLALLAILYLRLGFKKTFYLSIAILIASIPLGGEIALAFEEAVESTKFGQRGLDSPRWAMWESYVDYQTVWSFLLGTDTEYVPIIRDYSGNPHNTFIRFHAYFGIIPLIVLLAAVIYQSARAPLLALPLAIILVRAGSDSLVAGTVLDVFFMIAFVPVMLAGSGARHARPRRVRTPAEYVPTPKRLPFPVLPVVPPHEGDEQNKKDHKAVEYELDCV